MPKLLVQNLGNKPLVVAIEPWASVETLQPEGQMTLECENLEGSPAIEFPLAVAMMDDGSLCVSLDGDRVSWTANGVETKYEG